MKKIFFYWILFGTFLIGCKSTQKQASGQDVKSNIKQISDDSLLTLVQYRTFQYFWKGAEPVSGMACERIHMDGDYPENDKNIITTGGSGFGFMAILVPAWDEAAVISSMLRATLNRIQHSNYRIFVGHYRNDPATAAAIASVADGRIHPVTVEADGPTTKADCLNHLYGIM